MEARPILSAMWRNKTGACLIALQIAVTLAVVVNALFIINGRIDKIGMPMGSDTPNLFSLQVVALSEDVNLEQMMRDDLKQIRGILGVRSAMPILSYLQSGSARADAYRAMPEVNDDREVLANINYSDEYGLETLGVELLAGRFFRPDEIKFIDPDYNQIPDSIVVTESLGRKFFPEGDLVGRSIFTGDDARSMEIIGVISNVATGWIAQEAAAFADTRYNFMLHPYMIYATRANYLIRAQEGELSSIIPAVEKQLLASDPDRLIRSVYTQEEILKRSYSNDHATVAILVVVMLLMITITGLGIVGLASFSVKQRTRQIGIRRALGARKQDILRYFILENLLLTSMGVILGCVLTQGVSYLLSVEFGGERLDPRYLPTGVIILYVLGLIAVFGPAKKASGIPAAIATRTV